MQLAFAAGGTLPYHMDLRPIPGFGGGFSPVDSPRRRVGPVSCYALVQGWLLLSQPPGCLNTTTAFPTQPALEDLSRGSGFFPSRRRNSSPAVQLLPFAGGIRSLVGFGKPSAPSPIQCSTSAIALATLAPKRFRGEQAISKFVWHFTPTHRSSPAFATAVSSSLRRRLRRFHSVHG